MARIIINIVQRTPRRPCRIDVRMDGSSHDSVAERNLMEEIYEKLREKWSVGDIDDRRAEGVK